MQITEKLTDLFSTKIVGDFVRQNLDEAPYDLALKHSGKVPFSLPPVLEWIDALKRARYKLPIHASKQCFFTKRAFEQCSSEASAQYKSSQLSGKNLLNLCGGIGVDDWAFSNSFEKVYSLEIDETLHDLAQANAEKLNLHQVNRLLQDAEQFLQSTTEHFDWIYADPDRRSQDRRLVSLKDCSPDILKLWPLIQSKSNKQLVKLSPLYPIENLKMELKGLYRIEVVAVDNEVKEILAYCDSNQQDLAIEYKATEVSRNHWESFMGEPSLGSAQRRLDESWFYEAHPAIAKANLGVAYAEKLGNKILIKNGLYQISQNEVTPFMGRKFRLLVLTPFNNKNFNRYLKENNITQANLSCRMFRYTPENLKKEFKLRDGGADYFFFFDDPMGKPHVVHAVSPKQETNNV